jgi:hypothetical protein
MELHHKRSLSVVQDMTYIWDSFGTLSLAKIFAISALGKRLLN